MSDGPRRIAYVTGTFNAGGTEIYLNRLLSHLDRARFDPRIVVMSDQGPLRYEAYGLAPVYPVHLAGKLFNAQGRAELRRLARWLRTERVEIVHVLMDFATIWGSIAAKMACSLPVVSSHRAGNFHVTGGLGTLLYLASTHLLVHHVIPNSGAAARSLTDWLIPKRKLSIVYNGIPRDRLPAGWQNQPESDVPVVCPEGNAAVVCMVSRLAPVKNHRMLLDAAAKVIGSGTAMRLKVVGSGDSEGELKAHARRLGIESAVEWTGYRADPTDEILTSHICALTSDTEGFPNTVVEYMACGRPVVATEVGGVPEIIEDGVTGVLVPPRDPSELARVLDRMIHDEPWRLRLGAAARGLVERSFTAEREAGETMAVYDQVLSRRGRSS